MLRLFILAAVSSAILADNEAEDSVRRVIGRPDERRGLDSDRHDEYDRRGLGDDRREYDERRAVGDRQNYVERLRGVEERGGVSDRRDYDGRREVGDRRDYDDRRGVDDRRGPDRSQYWWSDRSVQYTDDGPEVGPVILRNIKSNPEDQHRNINIRRQNQIVEDVYSPDYAQPTWIIDYRFLKTGGRDYVRGPGGQILILPPGVRSKEPQEYRNYDELIEHLRQKNLAERNQKPSYFMPLGQEAEPQQRGPY